MHAPDGAARGTVLVTHGYGEHSGRYAEVVAAMVGARLVVATYDLRGHGRSSGPRGHVDRFEEYVEDADALLAALAHDEAWRDAGRPALFGHSLGGLISTHVALAGQERFRGLAMTSPFFGIALAVPKLKIVLGRAASRVLPRLSQPTGLRGEQMTHDAAIAAAYDADPLGLKRATVRWFTEATRAQEVAFERAPTLRLPVFCMAGGDDGVAAVAATQRFFELLGSEDKELRVLAGLYHEVLNEIGRERLISGLAERIAGWPS